MLPNVLIITTHDSGRHVGCYGVPTVQTPAIDRVAAEGVRFDRMFAVSPICSPSRGGLLTGRYPLANGLVGLTGRHWNWEFNDYGQHLSHHLRSAGYHTAMFGLQHETKYIERLGFDDIAAHGVRDEQGCQVSAPQVADRVAAFLRAWQGERRPFYAQVGFFETHTDYGFGGAQPDEARGVWCPPYARCHQPHAWSKKMTRFQGEPGFGRQHLAGLQGALRQVDRAVQCIMESLEQTGQANNTVVLFNTDHGVELPGAKWTLHDPGLGIAFILRWPAGGVLGGRRCDGLLSNVDFVPTLCELIDVEPPANQQGLSFAAACRGQTQGTISPRSVAFSNWVDGLTFSARTDRYRLIRNAQPVDSYGRPCRPNELYDLALDPLELTEVSGEPVYAEALAMMGEHLDGWLREMNDPSMQHVIEGPTESDRVARYRALYEGSR